MVVDFELIVNISVLLFGMSTIFYLVKGYFEIKEVDKDGNLIGLSKKVLTIATLNILFSIYYSLREGDISYIVLGLIVAITVWGMFLGNVDNSLKENSK